MDVDFDLTIVSSEPQPEPLSILKAPPIAASYNDRIRPLLDAVDKLQNLKVMKEGIQLPTIVIVGDQSSGKSSVLESLAGISLPRGQDICTRVPLIMRLQDRRQDESPKLHLEFNGKIVNVSNEDDVSDAIVTATNVIASSGKGISNTPLTLVVKKDGAPDLTMVDLPGITRVPVHGQPENIYEQISEMIMEYIRPEETIILNVVSATVDFSTCESIRMSQMVDKTGKRTLAVVTKADKAPEGLLEKVTADDVNIGLGYVCVRNRIGDESYEEARLEEAKLFEMHPQLCKIDKSNVGVPVLAQKLMQIQATIMAKYLPEIIMKINDKLDANDAELKRMPKNMSSVEDAMMVFMEMMGSAKESLRKVLLRGELDEYPDEKDMHCTARLVEMLNQYYDELQNCPENDPTTNFLLEEIEVLEEVKGIGLPDVLPHTAFLTLLQRKVKGISSKLPSFGVCVWDYIEGVAIRALMRHSENYPQLQWSTNRAVFNLINKMKEKTIDRMTEIVEMEKLTDYTCNPEYLLERKKLMTQQDTFVNNYKRRYNVYLQEIGDVNVTHLWPRDEKLIQQAFDLKMRMTPYWKIVLRRFVDSVALHLRFSVQNLVNKEMDKEIWGKLSGAGIKRMMEETPKMAEKRLKLSRSIKLLRESAEVVTKFMDRIATDGDYLCCTDTFKWPTCRYPTPTRVSDTPTRVDTPPTRGPHNICFPT
ncbi:dynamin-related protein 4C-like [Syzygium oleosum]|uniref:dynamin-related protein 4C-like n=1 Tax=Syzygium oleosum TaxID=219896 RepID=UPI0024B987E5|nr:dynamin-related protein 4C-like [Syzygium oleosum]